MRDETDDKRPCRACGKPITIDPRIMTEGTLSGQPETIGIRVCLNPKCPSKVGGGEVPLNFRV